MSCGVGCRRGSDPMLLWLWCRPVATAQIQPLASEIPHDAGAALKIQQNTEKGRKKKGRKEEWKEGRKSGFEPASIMQYLCETA